VIAPAKSTAWPVARGGWRDEGGGEDVAFDEGREAAGRPCQPGPGRQAFTRLQALVGAGVPPPPADFGAVAANLDEAVRERGDRDGPPLPGAAGREGPG